MKVVCGYAAGQSYDIREPDSPHAFKNLTLQTSRCIAEGACLNATATLSGDDAVGNRTELALLYLSRDLGYEQSALRHEYGDPERVSPFTSDKKRMSSLFHTVRSASWSHFP